MTQQLQNTAHQDVAERQEAHLRQAATADMESSFRVPLLSRLWANDTAHAETWMRQLIERRRQREDCSDFILNSWLRARTLFGDRLSAEIKAELKDTATAARYYGGYTTEYSMFYNNENHHLNWAAAQYLAGQLWPNETFNYDSRTGAQHKQRTRFLIARWINRRARWGFGE